MAQINRLGETVHHLISNGIMEHWSKTQAKHKPTPSPGTLFC